VPVANPWFWAFLAALVWGLCTGLVGSRTLGRNLRLGIVLVLLAEVPRALLPLPFVSQPRSKAGLPCAYRSRCRRLGGERVCLRLRSSASSRSRHRLSMSPCGPMATDIAIVACVRMGRSLDTAAYPFHPLRCCSCLVIRMGHLPSLVTLAHVLSRPDETPGVSG
jgi:hypothetical protein